MFTPHDQKEKKDRKRKIAEWGIILSVIITMVVFLYPAVHSAKHAPADITRNRQREELESLKTYIFYSIKRTGKPPKSSNHPDSDYIATLFSENSPEKLSKRSYAFHPEFLQITEGLFLRDIPIAYAPPVDDNPFYVALFLDGTIRDTSLYEIERGMEYANAILSAKQSRNQ